MRRWRATGEPAFTLLELLVAVTVGSLLAALLLTVAVSSVALWNRTNGQLATAATARMVLDQVEADLRSAVFREDGGVWLAATVLTATTNSGNWLNTAFGRPAAESLVLDAAAIADCRFGQAGVWLRLFAAPAAQLEGEVQAVAYQIVRRRQTGAAGSEIAYMLFRWSINSQNTFNAGYNLDPASGGYLSTTGTTGNLRNPALDTVLADHVVDFGVRFLRYTDTELQPLFPASGGVWSNAELGHLVRLGATGTSETAVPDVVDVMVRILTEEGVALLRAYENASPGYVRGGTWWDIVGRHSQVYTRRIPLFGGSM